MRTALMKMVALFLATFFLCSCASTRMVDSWRNPNLRAPRMHKVLVVRISARDGNRHLFEDVLAEELRQRGVDAVAGHTLIPDDKKQSWEMVEGAVQKSGADGVLTLQTVNVEQHTTVQPSYPSIYPGYWYPSAFSAWDLRGYYGASMYYEPSYVSTYQVISIQSNLFDAHSGKLVWAATVESSDPEKTVSVSKDLARLVVQALVREGMI